MSLNLIAQNDVNGNPVLWVQDGEHLRLQIAKLTDLEVAGLPLDMAEYRFSYTVAVKNQDGTYRVLTAGPAETLELATSRLWAKFLIACGF